MRSVDRITQQKQSSQCLYIAAWSCLATSSRTSPQSSAKSSSSAALNWIAISLNGCFRGERHQGFQSPFLSSKKQRRHNTTTTTITILIATRRHTKWYTRFTGSYSATKACKFIMGAWRRVHTRPTLCPASTAFFDTL